MSVLYVQHFDNLLSIDGQVGWFHPLAIVSNTALDIAMQLSVLTSVDILD
jgi:hypothetical protein